MFTSVSAVFTSGHVPDAPLDVGVLVGLDEGVDGAHLALLVVSLVVAGASAVLVKGDRWDGVKLQGTRWQRLQIASVDRRGAQREIGGLQGLAADSDVLSQI